LKVLEQRQRDIESKLDAAVQARATSYGPEVCPDCGEVHSDVTVEDTVREFLFPDRGASGVAIDLRRECFLDELQVFADPEYWNAIAEQHKVEHGDHDVVNHAQSIQAAARALLVALGAVDE
jgi:hypothetical protein